VRPVRQATYPSVVPNRSPPPNNQQSGSRRPSADSYFPVPRRAASRRTSHDGGKQELEDEISLLLGNKRPQHPQSRSFIPPARKVSEPKEIKQPPLWEFRSHSKPAPSVPQSPITSVYVAVTEPRNRPIIPRGKLAPAPPPRAKLQPAVGDFADPSVPRIPKPPEPKMRWTPKSTGEALNDMPGRSELDYDMRGSQAGVADGGRKWADRLRERRYQA